MYVNVEYSDTNIELGRTTNRTEILPISLELIPVTVEITRTVGNASLTKEGREIFVEVLINNTGSETAYNVNWADNPSPDMLVTSGVSGALLLFGVPMQPLLLIAFGAIFIYSGHRGWQVYRSLATPAVLETASEAPIRAPKTVSCAPHQPTVNPPEGVDAELHKRDDEEPEEGYLAALAKEPEDPKPRP